MRPAMASAAHTIDDYAQSGISPELVLVDPELSGRVRPRVPLLFRRRIPPLPVLHLVAETNGAPVDMRQPAA
jgi:hypothetical protein